MVIFIFILINIIVVSFAIKINNFNEDAFRFPDYDYNRNLNEPKNDIRQRFLKRKKEMKLLEQYANHIDSNNTTLYLDGIIHYELNEDHQDWNRVNEITMDYKKILAAESVEYVYKRDHFWRTWRKVTYPDGVKVVFYKFRNFINETCKECNSGGYWDIEENPPCPFELYSMVNNYDICAANTNQPYDYKDPCPSVIKFTDITRTCDNPIITVYRIVRMFNHSNHQENSNTICGMQFDCEITTFYRIYKEFILFRVMNSNRDIIYSKIMKQANKNYYCIENCGRFDMKTKNITNEKPLSINLLTSRINKRENEFEELKKTTMENDKNILPKELIKNIFTRCKKIKNTGRQYFGRSKKTDPYKFSKRVTVSPCIKLSRQSNIDDYEDHSIYQDDEHNLS